MIQFILLVIVAFVGVLAGYLLSIIAPEELKPGEKNLWWFQTLLLITILLAFLTFRAATFWQMVLCGALLLLALRYTHKEDVDFEFHRLLYVLSAVILHMSMAQIEFLIIMASLIFLYGLPVAGIYASRNMKLSKAKLFLGILKNYGFFVVLGLLLVILA